MLKRNQFSALQVIRSWAVDDVTSSLRQNGLGDCCEAFERREIDGDDLLNLTEGKLVLWKRDLSPGAIRKLAKLVQDLNSSPEKYVRPKIECRETSESKVEVPTSGKPVVSQRGSPRSKYVQHVHNRIQSNSPVSDSGSWDTDFEDDNDIPFLPPPVNNFKSENPVKLVKAVKPVSLGNEYLPMSKPNIANRPPITASKPVVNGNRAPPQFKHLPVETQYPKPPAPLLHNIISNLNLEESVYSDGEGEDYYACIEEESRPPIPTNRLNSMPLWNQRNKSPLPVDSERSYVKANSYNQNKSQLFAQVITKNPSVRASFERTPSVPPKPSISSLETTSYEEEPDEYCCIKEEVHSSAAPPNLPKREYLMNKPPNVGILPGQKSPVLPSRMPYVSKIQPPVHNHPPSLPPREPFINKRGIDGPKPAFTHPRGYYLNEPVEESLKRSPLFPRREANSTANGLVPPPLPSRPGKAETRAVEEEVDYECIEDPEKRKASDGMLEDYLEPVSMTPRPDVIPVEPDSRIPFKIRQHPLQARQNSDDSSSVNDPSNTRLSDLLRKEMNNRKTPGVSKMSEETEKPATPDILTKGPSFSAKPPPPMVERPKQFPTNQRPLPPTPDPMNPRKNSRQMTQMPWYHNVERKRAEELLRNGENGYFLVRPSARTENPMTLTLWYNKRLYNISVRHRADLRYSLGTEKANEQSFANMDELLLYYHSEELVLYSGGERAGTTVLTSTPPRQQY